MIRIKDTAGRFWTGTCFGAEQNAREYLSFGDCPWHLFWGREGELAADTEPDGVKYYLGDSFEAEAWTVGRPEEEAE